MVMGLWHPLAAKKMHRRQFKRNRQKADKCQEFEYRFQLETTEIYLGVLQLLRMKCNNNRTNNKKINK